MTNSKWLRIYAGILCAFLFISCLCAFGYDPYFHYHAPLPGFHYVLRNERSQNDGIIRHFDYDSLITGTSMTENFKASEAEELFGGRFIKIPIGGATFKEVDGQVRKALKLHPDLRTVIRGLDLEHAADDKDELRTDLGQYPFYLYDDLLYNDLYYAVGKNMLKDSLYGLVHTLKHRSGPVITSFDDYGNWMKDAKFGMEYVKKAPPRPDVVCGANLEYLLKREDANVKQNVIQTAIEFPKTQFYYFIPPYSSVWWKGKRKNGTLAGWLEIERHLVTPCLGIPNIHFFSFSHLPEITCDINNYKDSTHYGEWINTWILQCMKTSTHCLTPTTYDSYRKELSNLYKSR